MPKCALPDNQKSNCPILTDQMYENFLGKIKKTDSCWLWSGAKNKFGYGIFNIGRPSFLAHRLMWSKNNQSNIPIGYCVLHSCDNPPCVNPDHLRIGTQIDNIRDRTRKGRSFRSRGELSGMSKLTNNQAKEIRERYNPRVVTRKFLADEYMVSVGTIKNIVSGRTYG